MFRRWRRLRSAWLTFCNGAAVAAAAVAVAAAAVAAATAINRPRTFAALSFIRCANEQQLTHIHMRAYVHTHTHTHRRASLQRVVKSERSLCVRTLTAGSSCANGRSAPVLPPMPPTMLLLLPPTHAAPIYPFPPFISLLLFSLQRPFVGWQRQHLVFGGFMFCFCCTCNINNGARGTLASLRHSLHSSTLLVRLRLRVGSTTTARRLKNNFAHCPRSQRAPDGSITWYFPNGLLSLSRPHIASPSLFLSLFSSLSF